MVYTEEEILAISAYIASLGPGPAIPTSEQYSLDVYLETLPEDEREAAREEAEERAWEEERRRRDRKPAA